MRNIIILGSSLLVAGAWGCLEGERTERSLPRPIVSPRCNPDGFCQMPRESYLTCPQDCRRPTPVCGNRRCEQSLGESSDTCRRDCPICGDEIICGENESCRTCPEECGSCKEIQCVVDLRSDDGLGLETEESITCGVWVEGDGDLSAFYCSIDEGGECTLYLEPRFVEDNPDYSVTTPEIAPDPASAGADSCTYDAGYPKVGCGLVDCESSSSLGQLLVGAGGLSAQHVFTCSSYGDGRCGSAEDCASSPDDCGRCSDEGDGDEDDGDDVPDPGAGDHGGCGDGTCADGEHAGNCVADCNLGCGSGCGDGFCCGNEDTVNCPRDCS